MSLNKRLINTGGAGGRVCGSIVGAELTGINYSFPVNIDAYSINLDGTKMLIMDGAFAKIYNMSVAYDITTLSEDVGNNINLATFTGLSGWYGCLFNNDGTQVAFHSLNASSVYYFNLSIPYDLTSNGAIQTIAFNDVDGARGYGLHWNGNGTTLTVGRFVTTVISQWSVTTAYDFSTVNLGSSLGTYTLQTGNYASGFNNDGSKFFAHNGGIFYEYDVVNYDINTMVYRGVTNAALAGNILSNIQSVPSDNSKIFMENASNVFEISLC